MRPSRFQVRIGAGLLAALAAASALAQVQRGSYEKPDVYEFAPPLEPERRYRREAAKPRQIVNADFFCTRCAREGRIPFETREEAAFLLEEEVTFPQEFRGRTSRRHGAFRFVEHDGGLVLERLREELDARNPIYIEDRFFRLYTDIRGFSTRKFPYPRRELELRQLSDIFPEVSEKTVKLDSHRRAHLYLIRAHRVLRDFAHTVDHDPEKREFWYLGPYLGMSQKFEIFIFPTQRHAGKFMNTFLGHPAYLDGECWHTLQDDSMIAIMHEQNLHDVWLNNTFTHRLAYNMLQGFRGYQYDLPAWFLLGYGHLMERRERTDFNTFFFGEGRMPTDWWGRGKWKPAIRKWVAKNEVRPLVELAPITHPNDITAEERGVIWSIVSYMMQELGQEEFGRLVRVVSEKREGETLHELQVRAFREVYDLDMLRLFEDWKEWVLRTYPPI